jgi:hypothetical protein
MLLPRWAGGEDRRVNRACKVIGVILGLGD